MRDLVVCMFQGETKPNAGNLAELHVLAKVGRSVVKALNVKAEIVKKSLKVHVAY